MTDQREIAAPGWFTAAAVAALLWELAGCALYLMRMTTEAAGLPADQRAIFEATPQWTLAAFAVAVWVGLAGAILLLMRRRLAVPLLAVSLLAVIAQNSALVLDGELRNLVASDDLLAPFLIILVCYGIWHLARTARRRNWLSKPVSGNCFLPTSRAGTGRRMSSERPRRFFPIQLWRGTSIPSRSNGRTK